VPSDSSVHSRADGVPIADATTAIYEPAPSAQIRTNHEPNPQVTVPQHRGIRDSDKSQGTHVPVTADIHQSGRLLPYISGSARHQ
jgi:hypothetical protein